MKTHFVKAIDTNVFTQGRVLELQDGSLSCVFPGVSFEIKVKAEAVYAQLEDFAENSHHNYVEVIVDGVVVNTLELSADKKTYLLVNRLDTSEFHTVKMVKRTEAFVGIIRFYGFQLGGFRTIDKPEKPTKKLLLIGDSFSCGYGNEVEINPDSAAIPGFTAKNENNYMAWGAIAARYKQYQYHCVAYSGRGLYRNFDLTTTNTLPLIYDYIFPDSSSGAKWQHNNYQPDVVVIKLGTNDFFGESRNPVEAVDSAAFVSTYITFIHRLKQLHPSAKLLCVVGGMLSDSWPEGRSCLSKKRTLVQEVIRQSKLDYGENQLFYLELPQQNTVYGEDWHPSVVWHKRYAQLLAEKLTELERF